MLGRAGNSTTAHREALLSRFCDVFGARAVAGLIADREFVADCDRQGLECDAPATGEEIAKIVAESYAQRLTAFDLAPDGSLSNRRVWADLGDGAHGENPASNAPASCANL